jgi:hypothetical protein
MSTWNPVRGAFASNRPLLGPVLLATAGLVVGFSIARLLPNHTATAQRLTGTITWSNDDTRTILFDADGSDPTDSQEYSVVGEHWFDAAGTEHTGGYPSCLVAHGGDPVRTDRRHVELGFIHQTGSTHAPQIAVAVRCFD